jgi:hypothetical protein
VIKHHERERQGIIGVFGLLDSVLRLVIHVATLSFDNHVYDDEQSG